MRISGPFAARAFDANFMAHVYEHPFEVCYAATPAEAPARKDASAPIGRHLDGCRIGFDAGGSDRKVSAVINGESVYSEEVVWFPKTQSDPAYHFDGIVSAMKTAASKMPRVDAIGVSSAGVYINNHTMSASLFLKVGPEDYEKYVKDIYIRAAKEIGDVPLTVCNDGDVTALAGAMSLGEDGTRKALKRLRCSNTCIEQTAVLVREVHPGAFSSDTNRGIPSPALLPAAAGSHPPDGPQRNSRTGLGQAPAAPDTAIRIRKLLGRYDLHTVQRLAALSAAMEPEQAAHFAAQAELAAQLDADGVCCRVSQLAVNGRDLMAAGIPAGPGLRRTLEALLDAVIRGQLPNERQCLLDAAGQISAS